jgi:hypothetical protein
MRRGLRPVLAVAATACVLVSAADCGGGTSAADGRASAATARNQALTALRGLYQHIHAAHVGTAGSVGGFYAQCITNKSQDELFYDGSIESIYPLDRSLSKSSYQQQLNNIARAQGWAFNKNRQNVESGNAFPYEMARGSLGGHISVVDAPPRNTGDPKISGLIEITSSCFDAGAAARSLTKHGDDLPLPQASPASSS